MKKIIILTTLLALALVTINCNRPVPPNSYRMKTRGKLHLFGIPLPFSVPNPGIAINLKTNTPAGTAGTSGTVTEYNPGGGYVNTDAGGKFDAVNAVLPAPWNLKVAPNQSRCTTASSPTLGFNAVAGATYKVNCKWNIQLSLLIEPDFVDLTSFDTGGQSLTGITLKGGNGEGIFKQAQNLKVLYYKQVDGEDYELEREAPPISIAADGTKLVAPVPNNYSNHGLIHYRLLVVEEGVDEVYLAHGEFDVLYPLIEPTPTPTPCPPLMLCEVQY